MSNLFLSQRAKRFIHLAEVVPYARNEIKTLYHILLDSVQTSESYFCFQKYHVYLCDDISNFFSEDKLSDISTDNYDDTAGYDEPKMNINFLQYLLIYERKAFLFLMCVPLNSVFMYLNDDYLAPIAKWRILINK